MKLAYRDAYAFLATSKQIRAEGIPIFWGENIFEISIFLVLEKECFMAQHTLHLGKGGHAPYASFIRRVNITVYDNHCNYGWPNPSKNCMAPVNDACGTLVTYLDLSRSSIRVSLLSPTLEHQTRMEVVNRSDNTIFAPLGHLRGIRNVSVHGVEPKFGLDLEQSMMKQEPFENVRKLRKEVDDWPSHWKDWKYWEYLKGNHEEWAGTEIASMEKAWNKFRIADFKRCRDIVLLSIKSSHGNEGSFLLEDDVKLGIPIESLNVGEEASRSSAL